ncbi:MAG: sigma-70 family RNA polymerase sigma factor [Halobacteriovoraceae bacterium]|nr:sigma-70 family RNA polymerase sigma factor [Halobacteriovoraceae bacterium]
MNFNSPEFIELLKQKDHMAMTHLVNEYHEALYLGALKLKLGNDQAQEVVQATWSSFFQDAHKFQARSHIRTYLFGIMYNKIRETWRSNKKYTGDDDANFEQVFDQHGQYLNSPTDPSTWVESQEFMAILDEEIQKLPAKQMMAFTLKEVQGEKTQDICNILDVSSTNLGVLLYRAKNTLRIRIEKRMEE